MKKIFLSLPMSGRTNEEILGEIRYMEHVVGQNYIFDEIHDKSYAFVDNSYCEIPYCRPNENSSLLYLGEAIKKMAYCDAVVFSENYAKARGCMIEFAVARDYKIPIYGVRPDGTLQKYINEKWRDLND